MTKAILTPDDLIYMQTKVVDWNILGGNLPNDKTLIPTYHQLTTEELLGKGELLESWVKNDMVGVADGVADSVFTSFMWAVLDGWELGENNKWYELAQNTDNINCDMLGLLETLKHEVINNSAISYQTHFVLLLYKMSELMDVKSVFDVVCESNYSKYPLKTEVSNPEEEVTWIEEQGRYTGVFFEEVGDDRYVFKATEDVEEGVIFNKPKIVKSRQFKDVVGLETFIY